MVMQNIQVRMTQGLIREIDGLIDKGIYASRSDLIRDALREKLFWKQHIGILSAKGDSVKQTKKIRKKLSDNIRNWDDYKRSVQ